MNRLSLLLALVVVLMLAAIAGRQPDAAEQASRLHIQEAIDLVHDEEVN